MVTHTDGEVVSKGVHARLGALGERLRRRRCSLPLPLESFKTPSTAPDGALYRNVPFTPRDQPLTAPAGRLSPPAFAPLLPSRHRALSRRF